MGLPARFTSHESKDWRGRLIHEPPIAQLATCRQPNFACEEASTTSCWPARWDAQQLLLKLLCNHVCGVQSATVRNDDLPAGLAVGRPRVRDAANDVKAADHLQISRQHIMKRAE